MKNKIEKLENLINNNSLKQDDLFFILRIMKNIRLNGNPS